MNIKKNLLIRSMIGFPMGIAIGYVITILISLGWADGYYSPCVPELISAAGSEIHAVILQALLCGLLGAGFAACSVIWQLEDWSLMKQTGIYFLCISLIMMPVAYFTYWMEHSLTGFISYFSIFVLIFIVIWIIQFIIGKHCVKKLNANLHNTPNNDGQHL